MLGAALAALRPVPRDGLLRAARGTCTALCAPARSLVSVALAAGQTLVTFSLESTQSNSWSLMFLQNKVVDMLMDRHRE